MQTEARTNRKVRLPIPQLRSVAAGPAPAVPAEPAAPAPQTAQAALEALNRSFAAFVEKNDERLAQIENRGSDDVVTREAVDRINAEVGEMNNAVQAIVKQVTAGAALTGGTDTDAANAEYAKKFRGFLAGNVSREAMANIRSPRADLSTLSDPDGGFLVPTETELAVGRVAGTISVMRSISQVVSVGASSYTKQVNLGGSGSGWVGEKQDRNKTATPELSELKFDTHEIYAQPAVTQALLDDARLDISAWLGGEIAIEFEEKEGAAFVSGDGNAKPQGFLSASKVANASHAWGKLGFITSGVAAALTDGSNNGADRMIDTVYSLKAAYRGNGAWLMNDLTQAIVRKFKNSEGDYLWQPSIQVGTPATLLGYSAFTDDNMPDVAANAFPIAFGDFQRGYLIVDRQGIRVLPDPFTSKPKVLIYTTKRVGGGVQNYEAIKLLKVAA